MQIKIIFILLLASIAWSANTLHSQPRVVERYSNGEISGEAIDLSICLETEAVANNPTHADSREKYEEIIKFWADIIYEMSNGGNYLGTIRIFSGSQFKVGCDVIWSSSNGRSSSTPSGIKNNGQLFFYDRWGVDYRSTEKLRFDWGTTLAHESMHYIYGLKDEYGTINFVASESNWWFKNVKTFTTYANSLTNQIIVQTTIDYPDYAYRMGWFETYGSVPSNGC